MTAGTAHVWFGLMKWCTCLSLRFLDHVFCTVCVWLCIIPTDFAVLLSSILRNPEFALMVPNYLLTNVGVTVSALDAKFPETV
jgi:hypothetical protein